VADQGFCVGVAVQRGKKKPSPVVKAAKPSKPEAEQFIGHDSVTMMGDESFAEFEARAKAREEATGAMPAHVPSKPPPPVPTSDEEPGDAVLPDDSLPDEVEE
jgi:hypothetical protein